MLDGRYGRKRVPNITKSEPTGTATISGNTITSDGVYVIPSGFSGTIQVANGVQNIEIRHQGRGPQNQRHRRRDEAGPGRH